MVFFAKKRLNFAKNGWAKPSKKREAKRLKDILTQSFASRFLLRFAQPFFAKVKWTINCSLSARELNFIKIIIFLISRARQKFTDG